MLLEVVILWVLCAIGAALIANAKGRSVPNFFFAGLLLGLIGLIWAACAQPAGRDPQPIATTEEPARWRRDPNEPQYERYWNGQHWTRHVRHRTS